MFRSKLTLTLIALLPVVPPPQGEVTIHGVIEIPSIPPNIFGMLSQSGPASSGLLLPRWCW